MIPKSGESVYLPSMVASELHGSKNYEEVMEIVNRSLPPGDSQYYPEWMIDLIDHDESFANPSLLTGKTWGEIRQ